MRSLLSTLLIVLACASSALANSLPTDVVNLTDDNFEHDTQAGSGQTTGAWAVLFTAPGLRNSDAHDKLFDELAADEEKEVIYAKVDMKTNKALATRFSALFLPSVVLFRDRKMYVYDAPLDGEDGFEKVQHFVTEGYETAEAREVPGSFKRPTLMDSDTFNPEKRKENKYNNIWIGIGCILVAAIFRAYASMEKEKAEKEKKQEAAEKLKDVLEGSGADAGATPTKPSKSNRRRA